MNMKLKAALLSVLILATTIPLIPNVHADTRTLEHVHTNVTATNQDTWAYRVLPDWILIKSHPLTALEAPVGKIEAINAGRRVLGKKRCKLLRMKRYDEGSLYVIQYSCNNVLTVVDVYSLL